MDDKKIKELIQSDRSAPEAPLNEWAQINAKISVKRTSKTSFKYFAGAFACCLILFALNTEFFFSSGDQELNEAVAEYVLEDLYFDNEDLYAWVD
jgi:hypothetical protein